MSKFYVRIENAQGVIAEKNDCSTIQEATAIAFGSRIIGDYSGEFGIDGYACKIQFERKNSRYTMREISKAGEFVSRKKTKQWLITCIEAYMNMAMFSYKFEMRGRQ